MGDVWANPPGGLDRQAKKAARRTRLRATIAMLMSLFLLTGAAVYATMKESTPVSAQTALQEFHTNSHHEKKSTSAPGQTKIHKKSTAPRKNESRARTDSPVESTDTQNVAAGTAPTQTQSTESTKSVKAQHSDTAPQRSSSTIGTPKEGVYTWDIDGYEQAPGVHRDLPDRSQRVITHEGPHSWTEHHIFSEQRDEWFGLVVSKDGVSTDWSRNRVVMGPVTEDKTVVFDPAVFVSVFPFKLGQTWSGEWSGKTSGTYTGKTTEHGYLTIGDEKVEVYCTEVTMKMHGDLEGEVLTRSWVAPEYRLVVKQYQKMNVSTGPGSYTSEWTGQVESLQPQT